MQFTPRRQRMPDRAGFSLVEMLIVVTLIGILTLMVMPRVESALAARSVSAARTSFANLLLRVKTAAIAARQTGTVVINGGSAYGTVTTPAGGVRFLSDPVQLGELNVATSPSSLTITVQPTGLITSGLPAIIKFGRGSKVDSIRITGYGRVE